MIRPFKAYVEAAEKFISGAAHQETLDRIVKNSMAIGAMEAKQKMEKSMPREGATVLSLPIASDLSEFAYEEATRVMREYVNKAGRSFIGGLTLHASFWNVDDALAIMAKYRNCHLHITPEFPPEKWALENEYHNLIVECDGA